MPSALRSLDLPRVMACCLCSLLLASPLLAAESFKRLSAADVERLFVGRTVGDEAHWSYRFVADGAVEAMDLGKITRGVWRFSRGELCLDFTERGKPVSDCYEVWLSGKNVRFLRAGVLIVEGLLLDE